MGTKELLLALRCQYKGDLNNGLSEFFSCLGILVKAESQAKSFKASNSAR